MFFRLILAQARTVRVIDYNKYNDVIVGYKTKKIGTMFNDTD